MTDDSIVFTTACRRCKLLLDAADIAANSTVLWRPPLHLSQHRSVRPSILDKTYCSIVHTWWHVFYFMTVQHSESRPAPPHPLPPLAYPSPPKCSHMAVQMGQLQPHQPEGLQGLARSGPLALPHPACPLSLRMKKSHKQRRRVTRSKVSQTRSCMSHLHPYHGHHLCTMQYTAVACHAMHAGGALLLSSAWADDKARCLQGSFKSTSSSTYCDTVQ